MEEKIRAKKKVFIKRGKKSEDKLEVEK